MKKKNIANFLKTILLTLSWLLVFDIAIQMFLTIPLMESSKLKQYFNYGLSVEKQLKNMLGKDLYPKSVLYAGWFDTESYKKLGEEADMTIYGMSFSNQVAAQVRELTTDIDVRTISGPGVPLNHSYYAYQVDKDICRSKYVVLGILSTAIINIDAMTNDTLGTDHIHGSFYPRFKQQGLNLTAVFPKINSFNDLKTSIYNNNLWADHLQTLKANDNHYSEFIYKSNFLDISVLGKLFKRWYKIKRNNSITNEIHNKEGYNLKNENIKIANLIVENFAKEVRDNNSVPIVLLFQTQGFDDHLFTALENTLVRNRIDFISSHTIAPANDPSNFISDGHFTKENTRKIAIELLNLIEIKNNL